MDVIVEKGAVLAEVNALIFNAGVWCGFSLRSLTWPNARDFPCERDNSNVKAPSFQSLPSSSVCCPTTLQMKNAEQQQKYVETELETVSSSLRNYVQKEVQLPSLLS
jgi:hypothetical protein